MDNIMTIEEVARYLKMKPQTIYTWAQKGKIPAAKIGKEWRFRKDLLDEWFNQHVDDKFQELVEKIETKKKEDKNREAAINMGAEKASYEFIRVK